MSVTVMTYDEATERARQRSGLCTALKMLLVDQLDLHPLDPGWITNDQPLFGRGLELDSVESLQIAGSMEYGFHVTLTDDDVGALGSVNTLVDYIEAQDGGPSLLALAQAPPGAGALLEGHDSQHGGAHAETAGEGTDR